MQFKRFNNLDAMKAWAQAYAIACEQKVWCDNGIYTDNNGLTFRPQVFLVADGRETISLRWNAFCEQADIDYIGPYARRAANNASSWLGNQVQAAINATY